MTVFPRLTLAAALLGAVAFPAMAQGTSTRVHSHRHANVHHVATTPTVSGDSSRSSAGASTGMTDSRSVTPKPAAPAGNDVGIDAKSHASAGTAPATSPTRPLVTAPTTSPTGTPRAN